jgi:hypothetical protein
VGAEYYQADGRYSFEDVVYENPGLVEFLSFQVRIAGRF